MRNARRRWRKRQRGRQRILGKGEELRGRLRRTKNRKGRQRSLRHWYKSGWVSLSLYSGNATDLIARSQDELILHRILYKLFHIEESIERNAREIKARNKTLAGLKEEQRVHEKALEEARKEQAQARSNTMQKEKKVKKAEKAVDAKVSVFNALSYLFLDN
jgi:hypothetical protein